ncbi:MAG: HXXEE domain-containing protein [Longimicrobiaceae bacterium]
MPEPEWEVSFLDIAVRFTVEERMIDLSRRAALLGVPVLMTLHNAEEALFIPRTLPEIATRLPASLAGALPSAQQMHVALAVATVVPWLVWLLGRESRVGTRLLLLLQCVVLVNVAWHVAAAVMLGGYAPGLATALALNLPFSIYLLRRAVSEQWVTRRALAGLLALALFIHGPAVALMMLIAAPQ